MYEYLNSETNRAMSKLLHEKGCVSESGYDWVEISDYEKIRLSKTHIICFNVPDTEKDISIPAFTFEDCVRKENAVKWAGKGKLVSHPYLFSKVREKPSVAYTHFLVPDWRYAMQKLLEFYEAGSHESWQQYVIDALQVKKEI